MSSISSLSASSVFVSSLTYHMPQLSPSMPPTNPVSTNAEASVQSDNFYNLLQHTPSSVPPRDMVMILGDFNACVGSNLVSQSSVTGSRGLGECNKNGTRLLDFRGGTSSSLKTYGSSTNHFIRQLGTAMVTALDLVT